MFVLFMIEKALYILIDLDFELSSYNRTSISEIYWLFNIFLGFEDPRGQNRSCQTVTSENGIFSDFSDHIGVFYALICSQSCS